MASTTAALSIPVVLWNDQGEGRVSGNETAGLARCETDAGTLDQMDGSVRSRQSYLEDRFSLDAGKRGSAMGISDPMAISLPDFVALAPANRSCCSLTSTLFQSKREDWSTDPFKLVEQDGYFYGLGTADDKFMAAAFVANLIRYKQEGVEARSRHRCRLGN